MSTNTGPNFALTIDDVVAPNEFVAEPEQFRIARQQVLAARARPEIVVSELPAPSRLAPFAFAHSADVVLDGDEIATGRFIVLHDPAGHSAWEGTFRCVTFAKAEIEQELAVDPLLTEVGWSWLLDSLGDHGADFHADNGSVTVVRSDSFGQMEQDGSSAQMEIRASWTPNDQLAPHAEAWFALLAQIAGLPPLHPDVVPLRGRRNGR